MKEFFVLKILDGFKGLYEKLGVNYPIMRKILQIKFTMDSRRVSTVMGNNIKEEKKKEKNNYRSLLIFNVFMSIFLCLILVGGQSVIKSVNIITGINLFMMVSLMISDFSSVLLDVKEKNILLSKPIDNTTFNAAKVTHIAFYMLGIDFSLNLLPLIVGSIKYGIIFGPIYLIENILISFLVVVITALLYTLVLKFFDGEKLKDIINYFQIILAFVVSFGYQLFNRMFSFSFLDKAYEKKIWHLFLPSMWFSAPFGIFIEKNYSGFLIALSIISLILPILLIIFYIKRIVPYFEENLQKLNNNGGSIKTKIRFRKDLFSKIICRDKVERSMFIFTKSMLSSERNFKLKVYPYIGMAVFMPLLFVFTDSNESFIEKIKNGFYGKFHFLLYITILMLCFSIAYLNNSDNYKGAYIYKVIPIKDPSPIFKGAIKGILMQIILPIYLVINILILILKGKSIILDLLIMFLVLIISALVYFKTSNKALPFSIKFATADSGKLIFPAFVTVLIIGLSVLIHFILRNNQLGLGIFATILFVINLILWKISFKISFKEIDF